MLSGHAEQLYIRDALAAGAQGYVMKGDPKQILAAIRTVLQGETYVSQQISNA
jgi:DNA-binding NarL/FixJ family response regulator